MQEIVKGNYPRPDFIRTNYQSLNGKWEFDFDDDGALEKSFFAGKQIQLEKTIRVPFPYQSPASEVFDTTDHEVMWYKRTFAVAPENVGKTALLKFGAVEHDADVWLNGAYLGKHVGGYTPFYFEITSQLCEGENEIVVRVEDLCAEDQVRGKQVWDGIPASCHYVAVSGIWQEVWIEYTSETYITRVKHTPDYDNNCTYVDIFFNKPVKGKVKLVVEREGELFCEMEQTVNGNSALCTVRFADMSHRSFKYYNWTPDMPNLFDITTTLYSEEKELDTVLTYFGFRKIAVHGDRIYLNNSQYYLRTVLDQGYWTEGIYRPADDDGFRLDVQLTKELGFNGARKHQKIEDPKYYYWADKLGLLVWGELPSFFAFTDRSQKDAVRTMEEFIERDYNHPSIMAWVPFNETWGLRKINGNPYQLNFARMMYYLCHSADNTRLVSTADGWENVAPSDFLSVHDYRPLTEDMVKYYSDREFLKNGSARTGFPFVLPGQEFGEIPILYTEFGGKKIGMDKMAWGYNTSFAKVEDFVEDLRHEVGELIKIPTFAGYCYTQLTDCYQEANGLLDMDRKPKADIALFKEIFGTAPFRKRH